MSNEMITTLAEIVPCGLYPIAAAKDLLGCLDEHGLEPVSLLFPGAVYDRGTKVVPPGHIRVAARRAQEGDDQESVATAFMDAIDQFAETVTA